MLKGSLHLLIEHSSLLAAFGPHGPDIVHHGKVVALKLFIRLLVSCWKASVAPHVHHVVPPLIS